MSSVADPSLPSVPTDGKPRHKVTMVLDCGHFFDFRHRWPERGMRIECHHCRALRTVVGDA